LPHVVLNGEVEIKDIFQNMGAYFHKEVDEIIRLSEFYISKDMNSLLIKALSIEKQKKVSFFILVNKRIDGLVIRLYPNFEVSKTIGVKKSLAAVAKSILEKFNSLEIGKTNLQDYL
jgi:hypothetical protein